MAAKRRQERAYLVCRAGGGYREGRYLAVTSASTPDRLPPSCGRVLTVYAASSDAAKRAFRAQAKLHNFSGLGRRSRGRSVRSNRCQITRDSSGKLHRNCGRRRR